MKFFNNYGLAQLTSWQVGGPAEFICFPECFFDIEQAINYAQKNKLPINVLSGGSNLLVSDSGIKGLVICLKNFSKLESEIKQDRLIIQATAGTAKSELLKCFLKYKLSPALFLAGIPGDVGGGVVMNAGVSENIEPKEFVEIVDWIEVLNFDGQKKIFKKSELQWSYRQCVGWQPGIILNVGMSWPAQPDDSILVQVKSANQIRLAKQPLDLPSCGSVFKNPQGYKAAVLIDSCNLKGYTVGGAQVSMKHANFIVNLGGATAQDIWQIILHVQKTVESEKKVKLVTEVIRVGYW